MTRVKVDSNHFGYYVLRNFLLLYGYDEYSLSILQFSNSIEHRLMWAKEITDLDVLRDIARGVGVESVTFDGTLTIVINHEKEAT